MVCPHWTVRGKSSTLMCVRQHETRAVSLVACSSQLQFDYNVVVKGKDNWSVQWSSQRNNRREVFVPHWAAVDVLNHSTFHPSNRIDIKKCLPLINAVISEFTKTLEQAEPRQQERGVIVRTEMSFWIDLRWYYCTTTENVERSFWFDPDQPLSNPAQCSLCVCVCAEIDELEQLSL